MSIKKPAYLTLYESLREEIISGVRPFGCRLPSRRILARDRGVSAITAEHSIELLCEEGYAESRPKSGFYVTYREGDGFSLYTNSFATDDGIYFWFNNSQCEL